MTARPLYAAGVTILVTQAREVFIEFRDEAGLVVAVAGLKVDAAVTINEQMTDACRRALGAPGLSAAVH